MKQIFFLTLVLIATFIGKVQAQNPVSWSFSAKHVQGDEYDLIFTASIKTGWHVYSQYLPSEDGPVATSINFEPKPTLIGKATESASKPVYKKTAFDEMFNMQLTKYKHDLTMVQRVRSSDPKKLITGYVTFMTCNDSNCMPPTDVDFNFDLSKVSKAGKAEEKKNEPNSEGNKIEGPDKAEPVKWEYRAEKTGTNEYKLFFIATIDEGWHIYGKDIKGNGPIASSIKLDTNSNIELIGSLVDSSSSATNRVQSYDKTFKTNLVKFKKDYFLIQKIKVKDSTVVVKGSIHFMASDKDKSLDADNVSFSFFEKSSSKNLKIAMGLERKKLIESLKVAGNCSTDTNTESSDLSLFMIFVFGFLGGLFALLTPCVFPMVPLTVAFFTKRSRSRAEGLKNAAIYSLSIILIYVILGMSITIFFGDNALNWLSTHWIPNTLFFVLFVAFAISFFGYYDIKLPSSWSNNTDRAADRGGILGIFFMASTLSLVSFSCTGPIIGTLLVQAAEGGRLAPAIGMLGFASALALPFGLFSAFPGWLNSLPKSGGWMNTVKVVLGFVELALAFKFLSKADLTMHWGILKYETYMGVTVLCAIGMGLYLIGLIRFPHDDKGEKISLVRRGLGVLSLVLSVYLASGFMYNPKSETYATPYLMSGIAPPASYSYLYPRDCPAGINNCFKDYEVGLAYARAAGKPIMIDFTGHGCENCRKMEDNVWIKDEINNYLNKEYVIISLYADDREKLKEVEITPDGKTKLRTVGNKWAAFQKVNFRKQSQPLYVLITPDETVLNEPVGYTPNVKTYKEFLQCGLDNFEKWKTEKK
jgi:thiol:disulfide interchange protein